MKNINNYLSAQQVTSPSGAISKSEAKTGQSHKLEQEKLGSGHDAIAAVNQVFAELELAYHNQFHKAYSGDGTLNMAKKYWLSVLNEFPPSLILLAVRKLVRESKFLPTLANLISLCEDAGTLLDVPSARIAYIEACQAPAPKRNNQWSHPVVFWAGEHTGWNTLASLSEAEAFPLYEQQYQMLCRRLIQGEDLQKPTPLPLPATEDKSLTPEENRARMKALRARFNL